MIRKIGSAYVNTVKLENSDRLLTAITGIVRTNHYNNGTTDTAVCKRYDTLQPPSPGGFLGTVFVNSTEKQTVNGVPYGILFQNVTVLGSKLLPGDDLTGSYLITVDINSGEGCFEIDTTCVNPFNHLSFQDTSSFFHTTPDFAPGVIHVFTDECQGTEMAAVDPLSLAPINPSEGPKEVTFSWDPVAGAIAYEIEIDTIDATFSHIWMHRFIQTTELAVTIPVAPGVGKDVFWRVRATPTDCGFCLGPWTSPTMYTDVQTIASSGIPDSYILNQNYPNPFNASTVIQFTNKHDGNVTLEVFNILGQNVATLMEGFKPLGVYAVTWDGTDSRGNTVPSGLYFYRVSTDDFVSVKKMTLLK
jgi:hypothetical protein